ILLSFLQLQIVDEEDKDESSPYYTIQAKYGECLQWQIKRRAMDIIKLHYILQWHHLKGHLPALPSLPSIRALTRKHHVPQINAYFKFLCSALDGCFNCAPLCEFLEISACSIPRPDVHTQLPMRKPLEGYLRCAFVYDPAEMSGPRQLLDMLIPRRVVYK